MKNLRFQSLLKELNQRLRIFLMCTFVLILASCKNSSSTSVIDKEFEGDGDNLPRITQEMVSPPMLPKFDEVDKEGPKIVQVTFTVQEKKMEVAPGDSIWAFTYNGTVPGPMIVVHQNDFVELTLKNPATNTQMHNIDFHAATGALGGGEISLVNPGQQVTFRFRCAMAGVFVYHCAPGVVWFRFTLHPA